MSRSSSDSNSNRSNTVDMDDPLDGKPSEDAKLTHVDSCSSLPISGDDLEPPIPATLKRPPSSDDNVQLGQLGQDTIMQLLANASTLLTPSDLALAPNDPRSFLPTPFAPGQSARTLLEQQLRQKKEDELRGIQPPPKYTLPSQVSTQTNSTTFVQPHLSQNALMQQQMMIQPPPTAAAAARPSTAAETNLQQQHPLLTLQQQLAPGALLNSQLMSNTLQLNPQQLNALQFMINNPQLAAQQPNFNEVTIPALMGVGVGLPQLSRLRSAVPAPTLSTNNGIDLYWLLRQQQQSQIPQTLTQLTTQSQTVSGKSKTAQGQDTAAVKPPQKKTYKSSEKPRSARWNLRYNELVEFKRKEGHCRVPHGYPLNKKLAWWVMNQRAQYAQRHKKETNWLTKERLKQLDDLGFDWNPTGGGAKKTEKKASKSRKKKVMEEIVKKS